MTERLDPDSLRNATPSPLPPPPRAKPERGFTILRELFFIVLVAEFGIDGASVAMAWMYAKEFAAGDTGTQSMSLVAALVLCILEAGRIPLAFALRTETCRKIKAFCFAGILASAPITVFNLSQLLNIPAQARLNAVHDTGLVLASAKDRAAAFAGRQKLAQEAVERDERIFHEASARVQSGIGTLASLKHSCWKGYCAPDSRENILRANSNEARAEVAEAKKQLDRSRQALLAMDGAKITAELRAAEGEHTKAITASPLHRYAGMIFGVEPSAVSDTLMGWTVRLFVGVPSVLGAFLAALLTMIAVKPLPRPAPVRRDTIEIPDAIGVAAWPRLLNATEEILGPAVQSVVEERRAEAAAKPALDVNETSTRNGGGTEKTEAPPEEAVAAPPLQQEMKKPPRRVRRATAAKVRAAHTLKGTTASPWAGPVTRAPPLSPGAPPAPQAEAGIPFMITNAMKAELAGRGFSAEEISNMTPVQAIDLLKPVTQLYPKAANGHLKESTP
jgi:hypothetical protein